MAIFENQQIKVVYSTHVFTYVFTHSFNYKFSLVFCLHFMSFVIHQYWWGKKRDTGKRPLEKETMSW